VIVREKRRGTRLVLAQQHQRAALRVVQPAVREPVLRLFDELVLSFRVGARKPAVHFFEACIRASGHAADQIIYIDDRPDYVAAASALGYASIRV
jgi:HAD superfamily hydrolase (TIGR01509 family)